MGEVRVVIHNGAYTFAEVDFNKNGKPVAMKEWTNLQSSPYLWMLQHAIEQAQIALTKPVILVETQENISLSVERGDN